MGVSPRSVMGVQAGLAARMMVLGFCPGGDIWGQGKLGVQTFEEIDELPRMLGLDQTIR